MNLDALKQHWKPIALAGTVTLATIGFINDINSFAQDFIVPIFHEPVPTLSRAPDGDLYPGDRFTLSYTAPTEGYLSVWVQDAASGKVDKLLPTNGMGALHLNATNNTGDLGLRVKPGSKGTDVYEVLWTPESKPDHLPYSQYDTLAAFNAALDTLLRNIDGAQGSRINVPVYP